MQAALPYLSEKKADINVKPSPLSKTFPNICLQIKNAETKKMYTVSDCIHLFLFYHHLPSFSSHSFSLNPTSTVSSSTSSGRFTSMPLLASSSYISSSDISASLSLRPMSR